MTRAAKHTPKFRFIDLFCGIGGFRIAFERAGGECVFSCDYDKFSQQTYEANFGERPYGDIRQLNIAEIPEFDVLCAGFPCQPFSLAGVSKKNSLGRAHGFDDEKQGNLFFSIEEILRHHRPEAFVLENVKNLQSHDGGNTFKVIRNTLTKSLGYHVKTRIIDAQGLVPQHRERMFLVGFREPRFFEFPKFPTEGPKLGTILDSDVDDKIHAQRSSVENTCRTTRKNIKPQVTVLALVSSQMTMWLGLLVLVTIKTDLRY
jgi:DNA (cytosine-5)-methyltransferase 1